MARRESRHLRMRENEQVAGFSGDELLEDCAHRAESARELDARFLRDACGEALRRAGAQDGELVSHWRLVE